MRKISLKKIVKKLEKIANNSEKITEAATEFKLIFLNFGFFSEFKKLIFKFLAKISV